MNPKAQAFCTSCKRIAGSAQFTRGFSSLCDECDEGVAIVFGEAREAERLIAKAPREVLDRALVWFDSMHPEEMEKRAGRRVAIAQRLGELVGRNARPCTRPARPGGPVTLRFRFGRDRGACVDVEVDALTFQAVRKHCRTSGIGMGRFFTKALAGVLNQPAAGLAGAGARGGGEGGRE